MLLSITLLLSACQNPAQNTEQPEPEVIQAEEKSTTQELVRQSFDDYKSAIMNDQGELAIKYLDENTIGYYDRISKLTRVANREEILQLPFMDKIIILSIRMKATPEEIKSFNGERLLVFAIKNGMVGKDSVANNSIGDVVIEDNAVKGEILVKEKKTKIFMSFNQDEVGNWKIDLTSLFEVSSATFEKILAESSEDEETIILSMLEVTFGEKPKSSIWDSLEKE